MNESIALFFFIIFLRRLPNNNAPKPANKVPSNVPLES